MHAFKCIVSKEKDNLSGPMAGGKQCPHEFQQRKYKTCKKIIGIWNSNILVTLKRLLTHVYFINRNICIGNKVFW